MGGRERIGERRRSDVGGLSCRPCWEFPASSRSEEARAAFREGRLHIEQLHRIEDRAILAALERQRSIGVDVFTDGEFRRSGFQNDLVEAVEGFVATDRPAVVRIWQGPGGEPQGRGPDKW